MSGQDAHRAAQAVLPWLLNGTLAGDERAGVERHLRECAPCRAELDALRAMCACSAQPDPDCDPERALARLLPALDAGEAGPAPAPARLTLRQRLAANDARWLLRVAAVQFAVIALLGGLLLAPAPQDEGAYRALGAQAPAQAGLVLVFAPDTPERELRRIAQAGGVRIVGGPTSTGEHPIPVLSGLLAEPLGSGKPP